MSRALIRSSASRTRIQGRLAASSETFRAAEKSLIQENGIIRGENRRTRSIVESVEPVSTKMISAVSSLTLSIAPSIQSCSFLRIMHSETPVMRAVKQEYDQRSTPGGVNSLKFSRPYPDNELDGQWDRMHQDGNHC